MGTKTVRLGDVLFLKGHGTISIFSRAAFLICQTGVQMSAAALWDAVPFQKHSFSRQM